VSLQGDRGAKGDRGERGQRGEGMSRGTRRAFVALVALALAVAALSVLFTVTYFHREQGAQRQQGEMFERKLCTTLDSLAARQPPPGPPADLSRAYLEWQYGVLAQLGPDVGCAKAARP